MNGFLELSLMLAVPWHQAPLERICNKALFAESFLNQPSITHALGTEFGEASRVPRQPKEYIISALKHGAEAIAARCL